MNAHVVLHWDNFPPGTTFMVSQFRNEPYHGCWGILARLPDGRLAWVALGDPAEAVVVARSPVEVQQILTDLRFSDKMKKVAEEMGDWGDENPSGLPDPRTVPVINWDEVPEFVQLRVRRFRGDIWGIVASMPDGEEYLVMMDRLAQDAGHHTFSASQDEAQRTIAWLEMTTQVPPDPDPQIEERLRGVTSKTPLMSSVPGAFRAVPREEILRFVEEIHYVEMGWLIHLRRGQRESCICGSCRNRYVRWLDNIADYFQQLYGGVPTEILTAMRFAVQSWEIVEKNRQA
uniref:Uncharacterized protein n=1 Tax=candidate division WWE3 bacterium TaxID=2053526 RepID=A0A831YYM8_UNCKA